MQPVQDRQPLFVLPETTALAVIGCLDLLSTLYFIGRGEAHEANPFMASILQNYGATGFAAFKALALGVPLTVAELARRKHPDFVRNALRFGIVGYLGMYLLVYLAQKT